MSHDHAEEAAMPEVAQRLVERLPARGQHPARLLWEAAMRWVDEGGPQLGASIAFYTMFALAPLLVIAIAVAGAVFGVEAARGEIVGEIEGLIGKPAAQGIEALIESAWRHPDGLRAGLIGGITLLVGATGVFTELRRALNAMAHVKRPPSMIGTLVRARLMGLALVLGFGFLSIVSLLLSAVLQAVTDVLDMEALSLLLRLLDLSLSMLVLTTAFAALLRWLPDRAPSWPSVWMGAGCCAVLFFIGKYLIGLYLARSSVASSYGAAGSFVVVMLWVYYSAQILLFGGALTASRDAHRRTHPSDSVVA